MNAIVAYYSRFGNTEKVAGEIAGELRSAGLQVRAAEIEEFPMPMGGIEMMVVGSPTHKMGLPVEVRDRLGEMPDGVLKGIPFAAYDTSYRMNWLLSRFTASRRLERALRGLGGKRIAGPETFHVLGREGPLCDGEVERAREWTGEILEQLGYMEAGLSAAGGSGAGRLQG
jgi:flavodoxin